MSSTGLQLLRVSFQHQWIDTRFPFRYGIASMTRALHVVTEVELSWQGKMAVGVSAETWAPKWFSKNPDTSYEEDLPGFRAAVDGAAKLALREGRDFGSWWSALYHGQADWARESGTPPLLAHMGTAALERAVLHALGSLAGQGIHAWLLGSAHGIHPGLFRPETAGLSLAEILPQAPLGSLALRHTVGLGDALEPAVGDLEDGLPVSLVENIRHYGLRYFKIKLGGRKQEDLDRLKTLAGLLPQDARFTLDANENYPDMRVFRDCWEGWMRDPALAAWMERGLILVEQPLHRDHSLTDATGQILASWSGHPPFIIDEADASLEDLPRALALGYSGTSHKNCKGVMKGLANRALLHRAGPAALLSGEDLSNIGPIALQQDLAVMSALGIPHVERNGHHYFRGTTMWPDETGRAMLEAYPGLYNPLGEHHAALRIAGGMLDVSSLIHRPLGMCSAPSPMGMADGLP